MPRAGGLGHVKAGQRLGMMLLHCRTCCCMTSLPGAQLLAGMLYALCMLQLA